MNSYSIIQFITLVVYLILIVLVFLYARTRLRNVFLIYLVSSAMWSLTSFLAHADYTLGQATMWIRTVPFFSALVGVTYSYFITAFVNRGSRLVFRLGSVYLLALAILIALGYIPRAIVPLGDSNIVNDYGPWLAFLVVPGFGLVGMATVLMIKSYRASRNHEYRNRIIYLLVGIGVMVGFGLAFTAPPLTKYPVEHIGHLGNGLVITYTILRYRLLDIKLVVRKGLAYSGITVFITASYLIVLAVLNYFLHTWSTPVHLGAIAVMAMLLAWGFNPLTTVAQRVADRLFYGKRYDSREMVSTFAHRMSSVLDLNELAEAMLKPIVKAVGAKQVSLLMPADHSFNTHFAERLEEGEPVSQIKLRQDSPIVNWLKAKGKPLSRDEMEVKPEFKGLWEAERKAIDDAEIELFCPMKIKNNLIGILALSKKQPRGFYGSDDIDMLTTLANEGAVVVENARLYAEARQRADTDELTGLLNHRSFHGRTTEEIARCSRFGEIFSLLFMDLDLFKTYNDVHGHLEGDKLLKQVSQYIKDSLRTIDTAFRYGGDEFAVIMPQTSFDGAFKVAERIRKRMESQVDLKGLPLTCSIGVASWPTDGVMREEFVRAADAALYYAKQTGRNRTCLASQVALSQVLKMEVRPENKRSVLSTVYALAATVDAKDHHTYGHSKKVSKYATEIAEALGYSEEKLATIRTAALLHDIGKIGISDQLLTKPGPLTADEWQPMRSHPNLGVAILKHIDELKDCLAAVQYHHERYDGSGYPDGLKLDNIPLDARILSIADAYDAMTSPRPYRPRSLTREEALAELQRCAGAQFDPTLVDVFVRITSGLPVGTVSTTFNALDDF